MNKNKLLVIAIATVSLACSALVQAQVINVEIGDRPYYTDGPHYWERGVQMVWVPGHWGPHHHWIHGHYRHV